MTPCLRPWPNVQVFVLAAGLFLAACGGAQLAPAQAARTHTAAEVDGAPPAVTQEEIAWALALEKQVQQGYQPTPQEIERYKAIYERLAASQRDSPTPKAGEHREQPEVAQQARERLPQPGPDPNPNRSPTPKAGEHREQPEVAQQARERLPQPEPVPNPNRPARPSQADIDWAVALMQKITQGYKPTPQEVARYTDIFERLQASEAP